MSVYRSIDLVQRESLGLALEVIDEAGREFQAGAISERPKVLYNASTGRFVLRFRDEEQGRGYDAARAASAIADRVERPYAFRCSFRSLPSATPMKRMRPADPVARSSKAHSRYSPSWRGNGYVLHPPDVACRNAGRHGA